MKCRIALGDRTVLGLIAALQKLVDECPARGALPVAMLYVGEFNEESTPYEVRVAPAELGEPERVVLA